MKSFLSFSLFLFCLQILTIGHVAAQGRDFVGVSVTQFDNTPELKAQFYRYEVFRLDANAIHAFAKNQTSNFMLKLNLGAELSWSFNLAPRDMRGQNFKVTIAGENGLLDLPKGENKTYRGNLAYGGKAGLTIDQDFIYGVIFENGEEYYIEPVWYFVPDAARDLFVVYSSKDVVPRPDATCGATESRDFIKKHHNELEPAESEAKIMACYEVDVALATDWLMRVKFGTNTATLNHVIGVLNNVATNYDNEFTHQLMLMVGPTFVSDCSTCDPWTSSTDSGTLLGSFRNWGNSNGFGTNDYDVATLWTNRDLGGSVIGIAYLAGICNNSRYNVCQDFTTNANLLRVLQAHELGHNFNADHDASGSPYIMAPAVQNTTQWSAASIADINAYVQTKINQGNCFTSCGGGGGNPPVADFTSNHSNPICSGTVVQFSDLSTNNPTSWSWTFPGGTPGSSTQQNPSVTYNTPGTYNVTLVATNSAGSDTETKVNYVSVVNFPIASFTYTRVNRTVTFTNTSQFASTYFWDFGDGFTSTATNPIHTYPDDGTYTVLLEATNGCGTDDYVVNITIINPVNADFFATPTQVCQGGSVEFTNTSSSNATSFQWSFPGGSPASSVQSDPIVTYSTPGNYNVTLIAINGIFRDTTTKVNYIRVTGYPNANFSFTKNGKVVTFTNLSSNYTSLTWDYGDGTTSSNTAMNHTHTYLEDGTYTVVLTVSNPCGDDTHSVQFIILTMPDANFTADPQSGCVNFPVYFENLSSSNTDTVIWFFPGGTPMTSTDQNPVVQYTQRGIFPVRLIAANALGRDTLLRFNYIHADSVAVPGFGFVKTGKTVSFTNTSTFADYYTWNFGDGQTSSQTNPTHTYAVDSTYTVTLICHNNCGNSQISQQVEINSRPSANFQASVTSGCATLNTTFQNQSSANTTSYQWTFTGGSPATSTAQNPVVSYATPGTYTVRLVAINASGADTLTRTNYISVNSVPTAAFSGAVNLDTIQFSNISAGATSRMWLFGDGQTSSLVNPRHIYAQDGNYLVTLTSTNACGSTAASQSFTIVTPPTAGFSVDQAQGCAPFQANFTNQSSANAINYLWSFPGGNPSTSTLPNQVVAYTNEGSYPVQLIVSNSAFADTMAMTNFIKVNAIPDADFAYSLNLNQAAFSNNSVRGNSFAWNFGDSQTSNLTNPVHSYLADGTYQVVLQATNVCGTDSHNASLTVMTPPVAGFVASQTQGCTPFQANFSNQSSANVTSYLWSFPGGNPSTSTSPNPTVTYANPGSYDVQLIVSNTLYADTMLLSHYLSVNATPDAGFGFTVNLNHAAFDNNSLRGNSYFWNFGDSQTSVLPDPVHTYALDGTYQVSLVATNECGSDTHTAGLTIVTPPTAGFSVNQSHGCAPLQANFIDQSSYNAANFEWYFEGGTPAASTLRYPQVEYTQRGTFDVRLIVSNPAGHDTMFFENFININDVPVAQFSAVEALGTVQFTNLSQWADAWAWDFGNGSSSTVENPLYHYPVDGTYTVQLTATNECGSDVFETEILAISLLPEADFGTVAQVPSGCSPLEVQFVNLTQNVATGWLWEFAGGQPATSTVANPVVMYQTPGRYEVTLIAINPLGRDTMRKVDYILVNGSPSPDFNFQLTQTTAVFKNLSANADAYIWNFGDGNTSTEANPSHIFPGNGTYQVRLDTENECGTTFTVKTVVIQGQLPAVNFSSNATDFCVGDTVRFQDLSSENPFEWNWAFEGGTPQTSGLANPAIVYTVPGSYEVTLVARNLFGFNSLTRTAHIRIFGEPIAQFTATPTNLNVHFQNTSEQIGTIHWNFGDGGTSTQLSPNHTYAASGQYVVKLTISNPCGTDVRTQTINVQTSATSESPAFESLQVFPNPTDGAFVLALTGKPANSLKISLFDMLGRPVSSLEPVFITGKLNQEFDLSSFPKGMYLLRIQSPEGHLTKKIMVE